MKKLILQHWDSESLPEWAATASNTMREYAAKCGAEYRLLHGTPLFDMLPEGSLKEPRQFESNVHKLAILSEEFDSYDQVCMYDMDMCATPWAKSVFDDPGSLSIWHVTDPSSVNTYRYSWMVTGAVYKFNAQQRRNLRDVLLKINLNDPITFSGAAARFHQQTWDDECVLAVLINHPDCFLDPASLEQVDVRFEAVLTDVSASSARPSRPTKDEEVSVCHFMGKRKHHIVPTVYKWKGKKGPKIWLRCLVHEWRYVIASLVESYHARILVGFVKIRHRLIARSAIPLEMYAEVY